MNEELKEQLKAAKKKALRFAAVVAGTAPTGLLVGKKIMSPDVKALKDEKGGSKVVEGVVKGDGKNFTFQTLEKISLSEKKLKDLIESETELTVSVEWKVVEKLEEIVDEAFPTELTEAYTALKLEIAQAVQAMPSREISFTAPTEQFEKAVKKNDPEAGKKALDELRTQLETAQLLIPAEQMRVTYVEKMQNRYQALFDEDVPFNLDGFLERRSVLQKKWEGISKHPLSERSQATSYPIRQQEMDAEFRELLPLPERIVKDKNRRVAEFNSKIAELGEYYDAVKTALIDGKKVLSDKFEKPFSDLQRKDPSTWTSQQKFDDAEKVLVLLNQWMTEATKALEKRRKEQLEKGEIVLKFDGSELDESGLKDKIKEYLPQNGHGNLNQSLNDVLLGRGKATTGHTGVLHASAGKPGAQGGCTLFFERDGKGNVNVVGVGQHTSSTEYFIHYGLGLRGKKLSL